MAQRQGLLLGRVKGLVAALGVVRSLRQTADGGLPRRHRWAGVMQLPLLAEEGVSLHVEGQVAEFTWVRERRIIPVT